MVGRKLNLLLILLITLTLIFPATALSVKLGGKSKPAKKEKKKEGVKIEKISGVVIFVEGDKVMTDLGIKKGLGVGNTLYIYRTQEIEHPVTKEILKRTQIVALMKVEKVEDDLSEGRLKKKREEVKIGDLVSTVPPVISEEFVKRVGVAPFENSTDNPNAGGIVADTISSALSNVPQAKVGLLQIVERVNIESILKEQRFQISFGGEKVVELGKITNLDYLLIGKVASYNIEKTENRTSTYGGGTLVEYTELKVIVTVSVHAKLVKVETGEVVWSGNSSMQEKDSSLGNVLSNIDPITMAIVRNMFKRKYSDEQMFNLATKKVCENLIRDLSPILSKLTEE